MQHEDHPTQNEEIVQTYKTWDRCVTLYLDRFVKRELREEELLHRLKDGKILRPYWAKERLQNEAATLQFISEHTTIPVPKCRLYIEDNITHLETERITNAIELLEIEEATRPAAHAAVHDQITNTILPQLRAIRRNYIGSVDPSLPVFPPQRVYSRDRRQWERVTADTDCFTLCHNDLAPQNILICPQSFQIVGIIDWEFAGYFPSHYELPLWKTTCREERAQMYKEAEIRELALFGLKLEDLRDCVVTD